MINHSHRSSDVNIVDILYGCQPEINAKILPITTPALETLPPSIFNAFLHLCIAYDFSDNFSRDSERLFQYHKISAKIKTKCKVHTSFHSKHNLFIRGVVFVFGVLVWWYFPRGLLYMGYLSCHQRNVLALRIPSESQCSH